MRACALAGERRPVARSKKRLPSRRDRRDAALKRGADELMNLAEHVLEKNPRAIKQVRKIYESACLYIYRAIERAGRGEE